MQWPFVFAAAPNREPLFFGGGMQLTTREGSSRTDSMAFLMLVVAVMTAVLAFALGRNDPTLRTAVLLCITNLVTALTSIAATLLVGKPSTTHQVETKDATKLTTQESQTTSVQPMDVEKDGEKTI